MHDALAAPLPAFRPPTADQLREHLHEHPIDPPSIWVQRAPWLLLLGVVIAAVLVNDPAAMVVPWFVLLGVIAWQVYHRRKHHELEARIHKLHEQTLLRHHRDAIATGWRLLPDANVNQAVRTRVVLSLAHSLGEVGAHESALVALQTLDDDMPDELANASPGAMIRLQIAIESLLCDRLSDADEALRRARAVIDDLRAPAPLKALHLFATLVQDVKTHHTEEALAERETLLDRLRPMGVEAGYGYALMAHCCRAQGLEDEAATWWHRATLLLPVDAIVHRFPELAALRELPTSSAVPPPLESSQRVLLTGQSDLPDGRNRGEHSHLSNFIPLIQKNPVIRSKNRNLP